MGTLGAHAQRCEERARSEARPFYFTLCLNESKTEVVAFGRPDGLSARVAAVGSLGTYRRPFTKNLGVILHSALRSSNQMLPDVPSSRLKTKGERAFSAAAPDLWNTLPAELLGPPTRSSRC